jgi:hypothetical protein
MIITPKQSLFFLIVIVVSMSTAVAFTLGDQNQNLFLVGVMAFSPFIITIYHKLYRSDILLLLFLLNIAVFPPITNPESMRWSTVMYSFMFGLTFLAYKQLLYQKPLAIEMYQKLLKYLIYAYFIVLLIQQFSVLTGLPILNLREYDVINPWKLSSLSSEPSHSGRIVGILMYCYLTVREIVLKEKYDFILNIKQDRWPWIAFVWTMISMGSGTAFIFLGFVLLKIIRIKNITAILVIGLIISFVLVFLSIDSLERAWNFAVAILTFSPDTMMKEDHSASMRIVPLILLSSMLDISSLSGWFGHGVDSVSAIMSSMIPGTPEGFSGGGLLQIWYEYGFLSFALFVLFSFLATYNKQDHISIIFWFMVVFISTVNSQIVWLSIILLFTNKYFMLTRKI